MLKDFEIVCEGKEKKKPLPPRFYLSGKTPGGNHHPTLYVDPQDGGDSICLLIIDHRNDGKTRTWYHGDEDCDRLKAIGLKLDHIYVYSNE